MSGIVWLIATICSLIIAYWYTRKHGVKHPLLFFSAVLGLSTLCEVLFFLAASPLLLLKLFIVPQLEASGLADNVFWIIWLGNKGEDYVYALLIPLVYWLCRQVHRKYALFQ